MSVSGYFVEWRESLKIPNQLPNLHHSLDHSHNQAHHARPGTNLSIVQQSRWQSQALCPLEAYDQLYRCMHEAWNLYVGD